MTSTSSLSEGISRVRSRSGCQNCVSSTTSTVRYSPTSSQSQKVHICLKTSSGNRSWLMINSSAKIQTIRKQASVMKTAFSAKASSIPFWEVRHLISQTKKKSTFKQRPMVHSSITRIQRRITSHFSWAWVCTGKAQTGWLKVAVFKTQDKSLITDFSTACQPASVSLEVAEKPSKAAFATARTALALTSTAIPSNRTRRSFSATSMRTKNEFPTWKSTCLTSDPQVTDLPPSHQKGTTTTLQQQILWNRWQIGNQLSKDRYHKFASRYRRNNKTSEPYQRSKPVKATIQPKQETTIWTTLYLNLKSKTLERTQIQTRVVTHRPKASLTRFLHNRWSFIKTWPQSKL